MVKKKTKNSQLQYNKNEFEKSKCKTRNIGFINFENNI